MADFVWNYLPGVLFGGFVLLTFGWHIWEGRIRPAMIPRAEIERLADELIDRHGEQAQEMAFINEDRAWRRSRPFEQGQWRRVRQEIDRRAFP